MSQPTDVDKAQYWICLSCLRINHHSIHYCESCQSHQPAFAEMLSLVDARDQADIIRVDALLARAKESLHNKKGEKKQTKEKPAGKDQEKTVPVKRRASIEAQGLAGPQPGTQVAAANPTASESSPHSSTGHQTAPEPTTQEISAAEQPEMIPLTPWWPSATHLMQGTELAEVFQKAHTNGRRFPSAASWIPNTAEKTRERKKVSQTKSWYYAAAVLATVLLIVASIQWLFTPNYKLVQVQGIFWSVDIPIERAVTVSIKEDGSKGSTSNGGSIITKWVLMRTLHDEGTTREVSAPEINLPDDRFRAGEPAWVFRVDLVDLQGYVYPEYLPQDRWLQFESGQTYRATLKNGSIVQLEPIR